MTTDIRELQNLDTSLQHSIDPLTGEIFDPSQEVSPASNTALARYASTVRSNGLPVHIAALDKLSGVDAVAKLDMLSTYTGGESKSVGDYINQIVEIRGCTLAEHGPYLGMDGHEQPGFYYMIMKTGLIEKKRIPTPDEQFITIEQPVLIKTSANQVVELMMGMMSVMGWYDWKSSINVMFKGSKSAGYFAQIIREVRKEK